LNNLNKNIQIVRTLKSIMDSIKKTITNHFESMGLTASQSVLVGILAHENHDLGLKMSDLSKKMGLSNSTISGIVDRVEKLGIIERERSDKDRRVVYVKLTEKFKKNALSNRTEIEKIFQEILKKVDPDDLEKILSGLTTLDKIFKEYKT